MKYLRWISGLAGIALLALNVTGLFRSMRNEELYQEQNTGRLNDITITLEDAKRQLKKNPGESDMDFSIRANIIVNKSMMHYWKMEGLKKYNLRVPVWENYVLHITNSIKPDSRYEFQNYRKNLERGIGLCSTQSIVLKGVLKENGIEAHLWDIAGHVVVRAKVSENQWYILDPDFGLVVPYDTDKIEGDPEIVRSSYADMASLYKPHYDDPYTTDHVVEIYGKDGNHIYADSPLCENISYIAVWLVPLFLLLPLTFTLIKRKRISD